MARIVCIQHVCKFISCPYTNICIVYDSTSANSAASFPAICNAQPVLARFCHQLDRIVASSFHSYSPLCSSHCIPSHRDHPWNEFADDICTYFLEKPSTVLSIPRAPISQGVLDQIDIFLISVDPSFQIKLRALTISTAMPGIII